ncbi:hypothetical protein PhCBS80983_g01313 [Powellomyces hirtus]|uniref:G-protein coupled receptors family 3 profile domain-containing protein n=1 Tax=Powellomyces hirtus TaxID=109895 RepID=A0A507ECT7_9FUNG|nr:hypothetical protein PhCBS80983_g01313 [Powellomyces hirtus]
MRSLALCVQFSFALLCILPSVLGVVDIWVDCQQTSAGSGVQSNPWRDVDAAITQALGDLNGGKIRILLTSPGEYALNAENYDFAAWGNDIDLEITGEPTSWDGNDGPKIVRGSSVPTSKVQFTMGYGVTLTMSNLIFGLPNTPVPGNGTLFKWWFGMDVFMSNMYFNNITFQGGSNPDFETKNDVLSIQFSTEDSFMNTLVHAECKVLPGVYYYPTLSYSFVTIVGLQFKGPSIFAMRSGILSVDLIDSVIIKFTVSESTVNYPNPVAVFSEYYNAVLTKQHEFIIIRKDATVTAAGVSLRGNVGQISVIGKFTITDSEISSKYDTYRTEVNAKDAQVTFYLKDHTAAHDAGASQLYYILATAEAKLQLTNTVIQSTATLPSGILQCNGTATVALKAVTVTGHNCISDCIRLNEMGVLTITDSTFSKIVTQGSAFKLERLETDENWPVTVVKNSAFTEISNTVFSGSLATLEVHTSAFRHCRGASVLKPAAASTFTFDRCSFSNNWTPNDGSLISDCEGSVHFTNTSFTSNYAGGRGGALYCTVDSGQCTISVINSTFTNNTANVGGGMFIDRFSETPNLVVQRVNFSNNRALEYGGAWYTLARKALSFDDIRYMGNTAPHLPDRGTASSTFVPFGNWESLSLISGDTLPTFGISTIDSYQQPVMFEQENAAVVEIGLVDMNGTEVISSLATLYGPTVGVVDGGKLSFENVRVFGKTGSYRIRLAEDSSTEMSQFQPVMRPVNISTCEAPRQLLPALDTSELECRLPICQRGCSSPAGLCVADGHCSCIDPLYEGIACQLKKGENDSLTFAFSSGTAVFAGSTDVYEYSVKGRDTMLSQIEKIYKDKYIVIYRDFQSTIQPKLARRDTGSNTGETLYLKFSLADAQTGSFLDYRQLRAESTALQAALVSPQSMGVQVLEGALANTRITSAGSIIVIVCSTLCVLMVLAVAGTLFAKRENTAIRGTTHNLDMLLALGLAGLFAFPITDTTEPTTLSCRVQIWMLPWSIGLVSSILLVKAWGHYIRRKNKMALIAELPMSFKKAGVAVVVAIQLLYFALIAAWQAVEAPSPQLIYASQDRFWSCGGTEKKQTGFIIAFIGLTGALLLMACRFSYETIKIGWPVPALEDKFILVNAVNMLITGAISAGILLPNMMNGSAQFALRAAVMLLVAAGATASLLGYKLRLVFGPGGSSEDAMETKIKSIAMKSQKSSSLYQNVKYVPCKPESALVWQAIQVSLVQSYLELTDIDTKKGRFFYIDSLGVDVDTEDNNVLLQLPDGERVRMQMEGKKALEDWVKRFNEKKGKGHRTSMALSTASRVGTIPKQPNALNPSIKESDDEAIERA